MKERKDLKREIREMAKKAKEASYRLIRLSTDIKNKALCEMADDLEPLKIRSFTVSNYAVECK